MKKKRSKFKLPSDDFEFPTDGGSPNTPLDGTAPGRGP